jgi:hypothetical protein
MFYLLLGLAALVVGLIAARAFTQANPAVLARQIRFVGGVMLLAFGAILVLRGQSGIGALLGFLGWGLLMGRGVLPWGTGGWGGAQPSQGQASRVQTDHLDMELDHDTGAIRGRILKGRFAGWDIEMLAPADLVVLWQDYAFRDPPSAQILEAYLDRRHPTWREDIDRDFEGFGEDRDRRRTAQQPSMTREEALEILGLQEGAGEEDIRAAHRELMKKVHPDRGGSNYLAAKINEAKDVLLGD